MQFSLLYKLKRFEGLIWLLVLALYTQAMMLMINVCINSLVIVAITYAMGNCM